MSQANNIHSWAQYSCEDDDDDDYDLLAIDVRSKKSTLESKELKFEHLVHINNERSFNGSVQQVQFHPKSKMALVSLKSGQADLFEVDGERNRYIQNIQIPKTSKPYCMFKPDGNTIVITSETYNGIFYTYDLVSASIQSYSLRVGRESKEMSDFKFVGDLMACRKEGSCEVFLLTTKTYEIVGSIKLNEPVKAIQPYGDNELVVAGENSHLYIWDLRNSPSCKHRFTDEGNIHISSFDLSRVSQQVAVGSSCGIVNTYEFKDCLENRFPKPIKVFSNLNESCDILKYNPTGELLLMGSRAAPSQFRMIYTLSNTVYRNFPVAGKKYGHLISADFSPLGGYLALGCSNGRAQLCRLPYYKSY